MGIHRPTHLLKALLIAGIAVASLAGTSVVAHAYPPPPKDTHSLHCSAASISANGGMCTLTFTDKAKLEGVGQTVCFTSTFPGTFSPSSCVITDKNGKAMATFTANSSGCPSTEESVAKAKFTGTEQVVGTAAAVAADENGTAQTTVKVKCPDEDGDSVVVGSPPRGPGSTAAIATSARNTGASVAPLTAGQVVPAAAILAVIVMLSVAITGRLRLRRLRR